VVEASGEIPSKREEGDLTVTVLGPATTGLLGIAILDGGDGTPLGFLPVDPATLPAEVKFSEIPYGEQHVCLVRTASQARHGYLDRVAVAVPPEAGLRAAQTTLSARVQDVKIKLSCPGDPDLVVRTLHWLTRSDDPNWRPPVALSTSVWVDPMLMTDGEGLLHLRDLGPGHYALVLTGLDVEGGVEPERFLFQVPGPGQLEITCRPR
jgi:hypothetical protein